MLSFLLSRAFQSIPVLLVVAFISFAMFAFIGNPVTTMLGQEYSEAQRIALEAQLGLDQPVYIQFLNYIGRVLQGDFGISYSLKRPVLDIFVERIPATLELGFAAALFSFVVGIPMGIYAGIHRDGALSRAMLAISLVGVSLPTFLIGILLILIFPIWLGVLPSFGRGETVRIGWWTSGLVTASGLKSIILPAITLGLYQLTLVMRLVRAEMIEVMRTDYIRFARARGIPNRLIHYRHAIKNTLIPVITVAGLQLGALIAFAIVTETVFQWPGMGLLFIQAVALADIPVMSAYLLLTAAMFIVINLIVDMLYYVVDPRLRSERMR